ncbi:uncharacterized protein LOC131148583 [Malania oleifera]|uniref:uncharacterized protein LOC131148583 n=1 Tax=Malania oleifera TaxID=397392 RepID=UPI0025AEC038|nr:uncharacterized protein LOC131148583 [Malania oleifera]
MGSWGSRWGGRAESRGGFGEEGASKDGKGPTLGTGCKRRGGYIAGDGGVSSGLVIGGTFEIVDSRCCKAFTKFDWRGNPSKFYSGLDPLPEFLSLVQGPGFCKVLMLWNLSSTTLKYQLLLFKRATWVRSCHNISTMSCMHYSRQVQLLIISL